MSLLVSRLSRSLSHVCVTRSCFARLLSNSFSSSSLFQSPPCFIMYADTCGPGLLGRLCITEVTDFKFKTLGKKVPAELVSSLGMVTIGASHGWVASMKADGILRLHDDLNPFASKENPKRIPLPPLVTLPRCQTQIITNVSMSSSSPEDENCVVAVKFLGPQISFCRPGLSNPEWTNVEIENPCFHSSRVMFSKKDEMFHMPGSGGELVASWDLNQKHTLTMLHFENVENREFYDLDLCHTMDYLVESQPTGEMFMVKSCKVVDKISDEFVAKMKTRVIDVFKVDIEQGKAVYTRDIGDLTILISKCEPFCVTASTYSSIPLPCIRPNEVYIWDKGDLVVTNLSQIKSINLNIPGPYVIPPQDIA